MTFVTLFKKQATADDVDNWTFDVDETEMLSSCKPCVFYAFDNIGKSNIINTPKKINFNIVEILESTYHNTNGVVTIKNKGVYQISYTVVAESHNMKGEARGSLQAYIEINDGSGYIKIPGSTVSNYMRESSEGLTNYMVTKTLPIKITTENSKIRIMCLNSSSTTTSITKKDESSLYIVSIIKEM